MQAGPAAAGALVLLAALLGPVPEALALPQFTVETARACDTCHVRPGGWDNPELALRQCSLSCNSCHVNPTGGGLRSAGGLFWGRKRLSFFEKQGVRLPPVPAAGTDGDGGVGEGLSNPMVRLDPSEPVPPPLSEGRYAGIEPSRWLQIGTDLRLMAYFPELGGSSFFPMQTDVHVAVRPWQRRRPAAGRLTLLGTFGSEGSTAEEFDGFADRFFVKEWWALYDNLPYQFYVKAGRFLPAFGWRLDDHTAFVRQEQTFDNERQVTGIEVGVNPNYFYAHASAFVGSKSVIPHKPGAVPLGLRRPLHTTGDDTGKGAALSVGWRDLLWQAGASVMYENRSDANEVWAGANWSLNLFRAAHPWKGLELAPVIYLGELDWRHTRRDDRLFDISGVTMLHQLDVRLHRGLYLLLRWDWQDEDLEIVEPARQRYTVGLTLYALDHTQLLAQYRYNRERTGLTYDEMLAQVHLWY